MEIIDLTIFDCKKANLYIMCCMYTQIYRKLNEKSTITATMTAATRVMSTIATLASGKIVYHEMERTEDKNCE